MSLWLTHPLFLPSLIVGVTIVLWATSLLPEFITALLFFAAAMMAKIAPPEVIFGGFASSAFWLVFSGFVLGIAIRKTGLADRAAQALSARLTDSWPRMVASVVLLSYALAFVMPSNMGRIALLMPIVAAMARRAGIADGSRGWFGLALAVGFGTFPAFGDDFARQRAESGDERRGGGLVRYPSELCSLFTAAYAGAWLAERGGAGGADLLAVSR
ncbi:di- and tricarboxylate transporter [Klebsiella quasipneumoniae]|nr:di- and tricarboxylate transporter [Klebsiella quasipneumoniae]